MGRGNLKMSNNIKKNKWTRRENNLEREQDLEFLFEEGDWTGVSREDANTNKTVDLSIFINLFADQHNFFIAPGTSGLLFTQQINITPINGADCRLKGAWRQFLRALWKTPLAPSYEYFNSGLHRWLRTEIIQSSGIIQLRSLFNIESA